MVRFEAQERKAGLRRGGVLFLSDLLAADLELVGRRRFEWCGFDQPFAPGAVLLSKVWADDELTEGQKLQLAGFYSLRSLGVGVALEKSRHWRLRRLAERYGYPGDQEWRLDYDEGLVAA